MNQARLRWIANMLFRSKTSSFIKICTNTFRSKYDQCHKDARMNILDRIRWATDILSYDHKLMYRFMLIDQPKIDDVQPILDINGKT